MTDAEKILTRVRALNPPVLPPVLPDEYFYSSIPLCVLDAVYSIRLDYLQVVVPRIRNFCSKVSWSCYHRRLTSEERSCREFMKIFVDPLAASTMGKFKVSNGVLKSLVARQIVGAFLDEGIDTFADVSDWSWVPLVEHRVLALPSQATGVVFDYLLMLLGDEHRAKIDSRVEKFLRSAGVSGTLTQRRAQLAVSLAAKKLSSTGNNWPPRTLDLFMWENGNR